jgi:hypothetical protein
MRAKNSEAIDSMGRADLARHFFLFFVIKRA